MSLINQMLRELDHRAGAPALPATVRAAPPTPARPPQRRQPALLVMGVLGIASALWWQGAWHGGRELPLGSAQAAESVPAPTAPAVTVASVVVPPVDRAASAAASIDVPPAVPAAVAGPPTPPTPPSQRHAVPRDVLTAWAPMAASRKATAAPALPNTAGEAVDAVDADTAALAPLPQNARIDKRTRASKPQERADAAYRQGLAAHERGDYTEAARAYAAALQDAAALVPARVGLASVLIAQSRLTEAESLLQAGLAMDPQQALLVQPLARLRADRGDLAAAIGLMQSGLPGGSANADYRACLAALLQRAGQQREAAEHFDAALRLQPGNGIWWMGLGLSLSAQGQRDAARIAYTRARHAGNLSAELAHFVEQQLHDPL